MSRGRASGDRDGYVVKARDLLGALLSHRQYEEALARFDEFERSAVALDVGSPETVAADDDEQFGFARDDDGGDAHVRALMIVGPPGTGKSGLLTSIGRRPGFADVFGGDHGDVRPIVRFDVPDLPTPKEVVREICARLHSPAPQKWTRGQVSRHLRDLFRDVGLRYLQMDEAHVFVENLTARQIVVNARFLKFMLVSCRVPIILAGEEPLEELLRHNALERRMEAPIRLGPYVWGSMVEVQEWMALMGTLADRLGFEDSSLSADVDLAMRLYLDTGVIIGLLAKRIIEAGRVARAAAARDLTTAHFSSAWMRWGRKGGSVARDPFAIVEAQPVALDADPYSADPERLKQLWTARFHDAAPEDASALTRRGRRAPDKSKGGFGR